MALRVEICGIDTSTLPKLTAKESRELLHKIKEGDIESREYFIFANMRLVLSLVQRFDNKNVSSDDLFQVGCVGLLKAINNFDTTLNVMFSTYAVPMIIGEIRRYLRDRTSIKVSRSMRDLAYQAIQARDKLSVGSAAQPTLAEIAEELDINVREVACALDAISEPISIYEPVYSEGEDTILLMDQLNDNPNPAEGLMENVSLKDAIKSLPERERQVLELRYFKGKTQIEISEEVNISQAQVSRLEKSAINRMKAFF
jgi:RNA polymerase sporulation-specific sigma factor